MNITTARSFFEEISRRGSMPRLRNATGSWRFELGDEGNWVVNCDEGKLEAHVAAANEPAPLATFRGSATDLVRAVRGDDNENVLTLFMRGAFELEGDIPFAQRIQALIPLPEAKS
jgi:hypothetical protein